MFKKLIARFYLRNVERLLRQKRLDEAETAFARAARLVPLTAEQLYLRATVAFERNDYSAAIRYYESSLEKNPDHERAHVNLGLLLHEINNNAGALDHLAKALKINPRSAAALYNRARIHSETGNLTAALEDLNTAVKLQPSADAFNNRGLVYFRQEKYNEALADFDRSISLEPGNAYAYQNRAQTHYALGNYDGFNHDSDKANELMKRS